MFFNTDETFGLISRILHWTMALLILSLLALGLTIADMEPSLDSLWLYGLHKSLGFVALILVLLRLVWHRITPPPHPLGNPAALPQRLARGAHRVIYALLVIIPMAGWVGSSAIGLDTVLFNTLTLPPIAPVSEAWETTAFAVHWAATWALMGVLGLHIAGAFTRAIKGDNTLERMISGS